MKRHFIRPYYPIGTTLDNGRRTVVSTPLNVPTEFGNKPLPIINNRFWMNRRLRNWKPLLQNGKKIREFRCTENGNTCTRHSGRTGHTGTRDTSTLRSSGSDVFKRILCGKDLPTHSGKSVWKRPVIVL